METNDNVFASSIFDHFDAGSRESGDGVPTASEDPDKRPRTRAQRQPSHNVATSVSVLKSNNPFLRGFSPQTPDPLHSLSSSSRASSPPELVGLQSLVLEQHSLGEYFSIDEIPRTNYSDQELTNIARLLEASGRETWSRVPRIYTVLRIIGHISAIDSFLDQGLNDMWFPFNITQLPPTMSTFYRGKFIESQNMVMTKAMDLENTNVKRHTHFKKGEEFPFTIGKLLGHGGYGSVHKAHSSLTGRTYALKRFKRMRANRSEVESFKTELQVLLRINHHHCVELVASYTDPKNFGLLISPVADCNLAEYYQTVTNNEDNQKTLRTFFGCLSHGLQYLHHNKIRHRDIKPENVLVKGSEVFLTDFGISLDWENLTRSTTTEDSAKSWIYCAPEVANYLKRNSSSDIWSLGCVFLEMFTVLKGLTVQDLRNVLTSHSGQPRFYKGIDLAMQWARRLSERGIEAETEILSWIREMVIIEPAHRITALSLCSSIVKFDIKIRSKEEINIFCGECCTHDHELELSSGAGSDDDVWEEDFGAGMVTPATTAFTTDESRRLNEFQAISSTHSIEQDLERLALPGFQGEGSVNDDAQNEETARRSTPYLVTAPVESFRLEPGPKETARETEEGTKPKELTEGHDPTERVKRKTTLNHGVNVRRELILEVTDKHTPWPFVATGTRLPALSALSWETPEKFLISVRSDIPFMEYLRMSDTSQFERFQSAGLDDFVQMLHLLLLNGLDVDDDKYEVKSKDYKGFRPLQFTVLWTNYQSWTSFQKHTNIPNDICKLLIGFGARIDHKSPDCKSVFELSVDFGNAQIVQILLDLDSSNLFKDPLNLFNPAKKGYHHIVDMLLKNGADVSIRRNGDTIGNWVARLGEVHQIEVFKVLIAHGLGVDYGASNFRGGRRPLYFAAESGNLQLVEFLLSQGADPTYRAIGGPRVLDVTALDAAKSSLNEEVIKVIKAAQQEWKRKKKQKN